MNIKEIKKKIKEKVTKIKYSVYSRKFKNWDNPGKTFFFNKFIYQFKKCSVLFLVVFIVTLVINGIFYSQNIIVYCQDIFPFIYSVFIFAFLILNRKKILYYMIGSGMDFRKFFGSFLFIQISFFLIYLFNIQMKSDKVYELGLETLISTLTFEPSVLEFLPKQIGFLHLIFIFQLSVAILFLGLFISALYRWFVRR